MTLHYQFQFYQLMNEPSNQLTAIANQPSNPICPIIPISELHYNSNSHSNQSWNQVFNQSIHEISHSTDELTCQGTQSMEF